MKTTDLTHPLEDLEQMVQKHPTRTILAMISGGIVAGVLVRLLYDHQHPTRMDTALNAVHNLGDRARSLFR